jgi:subtilisin family serine protease
MRVLFAFALTLIVASVLAQEYIPNQYVILFKDNTPAAVRKMHLTNVTSHSLWASADNKIKSEWEILHFSGYSAQIFSEELVSFISARLEIRIVEQDQVVHKSACFEYPTVGGTWGLARLSSSNIQPLRSYITPETGGEGVNAYIIDTGILTTHTAFGGRAIVGRNFIPNESDVDLNGHGTHVAGTVGGNTYGIARKSTLIAVKCLDRNGSGTLAGVIDAVNWVAGQRRNDQKPCTANLSLGASYSLAVNNACDALVDAGCFVAVAAGNSNRDACLYSPASAPKCTSVAASDSSDIRAYFSNFGKCTDLFAPGVSVLSSYIGSTTATATLSGTSMAAPHVCGVATNYLGTNPTATPQQVHAWLINRGVKNTITDDAGSPNVLSHQACFD